MFNIGDLIIYSSHGICRIDDICEETYFGVTKDYYILHPMEENKLKISTPVDNNKVTMLELLTREEAEEILQSFRFAGTEWIEVESLRHELYSTAIKKGNRKEIARIANALIREKNRLEKESRKFHERDKRLLNSIENILFAELAFSLKTTYEAIEAKINNLITESVN